MNQVFALERAGQSWLRHLISEVWRTLEVPLLTATTGHNYFASNIHWVSVFQSDACILCSQHRMDAAYLSVCPDLISGVPMENDN